MVKVIELKKIYARCPKCKSILEAEMRDFVWVSKGRQEEDEIIHCPVCSYKIFSCYWKDSLEKI